MGLLPQPRCPWVSVVVLFPPLRVVCPLGFAPQAALEGSWCLGQREIECSRRVWQPVLANVLQYSCLENPTSLTEKPGRHSLRGCKESDMTKVTPRTQAQDFFLPVAALPQGELRVKAANRLACGDLAAPSVQGHGLPPLQELGPCQNLFFEPLVAGDQKASLASLSVAPPVQALGGSLAWAPLCLAHQHIETPPPPAGVLHCRSACRHLKGHPGWGPLYS